MSKCFMLGFVILATGCCIGSSPNDEPLDSGYDIRGEITTLHRTEPRLTILVEADPGSKSKVDKASVTIDSATDVRQAKDLKVGQVVEVTFNGPVAESYPVQARAGKVVIVKP